jgi:dTDP-4-amino-4,6-dideoxygalactose transaminase
LGCFSFCNDKIMTTGGEGGMVTTNDPELADRVWSWKEHGRNRRLFGMPTGGHYARVFDTVGTNARMTEMQSAIGREGLKAVPGWLALRKFHAEALGEDLIPGHAYYRLYRYTKTKVERDGILWEASRRGVPIGVGACPEIYLDNVFDDCRPKERLPVAKRLGERSIALLVDPCQDAASLAAQAEVMG